MTDDRRARILDAALAAFIRYGVRRVTMGDIARAAGMSRPALYLEFQNKEDIFAAAVEHVAATMLADIRRELPARQSLADRLALALEIWIVRPFALVQSSPDAEELLETAQGAARQVIADRMAEFEALLASLLAPHAAALQARGLHPSTFGQLLARAAKGLKAAAADIGELRAQLRDLVTVAVSLCDDAVHAAR